MAFPIGPDSRTGEPEAYFRIQDPFGLRRTTTPVFIRDLRDDTIRGCGTSFFISPFWHQLSAMHVVTDFFEESGIDIRPGATILTENPHARIEIFFDPGLVYGMAPAGTVLPATSMTMFPVDQHAHPLALTFTQARLRCVEPDLDLIAWDIIGIPDRKSQFLHVRINRTPLLKVGERVLAVGYPEILGERRPSRHLITFSEEMFGSFATVTEVQFKPDPDRHSWPNFTVDQHWPPGMSGGPVFNEAGEVIGIVSRGGPDWSRAVWIQALPYRPDIFRGIDPRNPGWIVGWAACNTNSVLDVFLTKEEAEQYVARNKLTGLTVKKVSTALKDRM